MDHSNPLAVVTPTLDGPVLLTLSSTTAEMTGREVQRRAGTGSPDGVRRVLTRLVQQGVVIRHEHAHATLYRLNRDHVAVDAILALTRLRTRIIDLTIAEIRSWAARPLHASFYGSFARNEATEASDIDVAIVIPDADGGENLWSEQLDRLDRSIHLWTGNTAHVVDVSTAALAEMLRNDDPLLQSWRSDAVHLDGEPVTDLLRAMRVRAGLPLRGLP